ncbi:MAG TPA: hydrogenase maturation nickel metallochaperone HypA [Thermoanaerobaculia bacterium]|nr:hydrogenase maturation nickel metallochaperone HypA [Thermoanaerobaculia bacterium]
MSIACSLLDAVRVELKAYPGARVTAIGVRIGELAGVDHESLKFGFDAIVKDTELDATRLEIRSAGRDELDLAFIELEDA